MLPRESKIAPRYGGKPNRNVEFLQWNRKPHTSNRKARRAKTAYFGKVSVDRLIDGSSRSAVWVAAGFGNPKEVFLILSLDG